MPDDWADLPAVFSQGTMRKLVKLTDPNTAVALEEVTISCLFAMDAGPTANVIRPMVARLRDWAEAGEDLFATADPDAVERLMNASEGRGNVVALINGLRDDLRVLRNLAEKALLEMPQPKRGRPTNALKRGFAREIAGILRAHGYDCIATKGNEGVQEDSLLVKVLDCIIGANAYHLARAAKS